MTLSYSLIGDSKGQTLSVVFTDGDVKSVPSSHANFTKVLGYLVDTAVDQADEDHIRDLLNLALAAGTRLTALSERVTLSGNSLFFDGDPLDSALSGHIIRLFTENDEQGWKALVNFLEKLAQNPSEESKASLYSWIADRNLTITKDGDFVAYKGVRVNEEGVSESIHAGAAFVDDLLVKGYIPNVNGSVISMPRSQVDRDTRNGCSTGLHAGTWDYASGFSRGRVLEVHINPRDVVSVPDDSSHQKLRVSRYLVVAATEQAYTATTVYPASDLPEDDYWGDGEDDSADDVYDSADEEEPDEYEEWEQKWAHDTDGKIREEFDIDFPETPEDAVTFLVEEHYFTEDYAKSRIFGN